MVRDIILKLQNELNAGIRTEVQVVYLLTAIRKIIEQESTAQQFEYLKFHADWALHFSLKGPFAQKILTAFNAAHIQFRDGIEFHDLPQPLRSDIENISGMRKFKVELSEFLQSHRLPDLTSGNLDSWTHFLHLYAKVIDDCPLVIRQDNQALDIAKVTVGVKVSDQRIRDQVFYKIGWNIEDRNGSSREFFVINSFSD